MRLTHRQKVRLARTHQTKEEMKRPRNEKTGKRERTSIWETEYWIRRKFAQENRIIKRRVAKRDKVKS